MPLLHEAFPELLYVLCFSLAFDHLLLLIHKHLLGRHQVPDTLVSIVRNPFSFSLLEGHTSIPLYPFFHTGREANPTDHPLTFCCEQYYSFWFFRPIPAGWWQACHSGPHCWLGKWMWDLLHVSHCLSACLSTWVPTFTKVDLCVGMCVCRRSDGEHDIWLCDISKGSSLMHLELNLKATDP